MQRDTLEINKNRSVTKFASNHNIAPDRSYGASARRILRDVAMDLNGEDYQKTPLTKWDQWAMEPQENLDIRVYYFDKLIKIKEVAIRSADVTLSILEGICGAITIAVVTNELYVFPK